MKKFLLLIGLVVYSTIMFGQATATLRAGSTDLTGITPGTKIYIPVYCDAISGDLITGYQFFIDYDHSVLSWDGTITNPLNGVINFHPNFPYSPSDYLFNENGTAIIATYIDPTYNGKLINAGESFLTFKFTYLGGETELIWENTGKKSGGSSPKYLTEVYDVNFTNFDLTLVNGCVCLPNFDATFHVTDNLSGTDLEGATVTVGTQSILTNAQGLAVFSLANGNYSYTVSKEGYTNKSGNFTVNNANVTIPVAMNCVGCEVDVTFQVTSGGNNLAEATVVVGSESAVTNALGEAIISLPDGDYNYSVSKYGYITQTGPFTVAGSAMNIPVDLPMLPHVDIIFHVTSGGNSLDGALVDIAGVESMLTDLNGEALFSLVDGDYNYTVSKEGYTTETGTFTVAGSTEVIEVELAQLFDVTFHVTDGTVDLQNAAVIVGTETKFTDASGITVFSLADGDYTYLVTKLDYEDVTGPFTVAGANQTIEITMSLVTYPVTFHVTSGGNNVEGALITIESLTALTNAGGIAVFDLSNGTYFYSVSKLGYYEEVGNFDVAGAATNVDVTLDPFYFEVLFHVTSGGIDLPDASVTIGSQTVITNTLGQALFSLINGPYNYTVTKAGYDTETGNFTVDNANLNIPVSMEITVWPITFHVTSGGANLEGATVTIGTQSATTDASGIAILTLPDGTYTYSVTKANYQAQSGPLTVAGAPQTITVDMTLITWPVTFHVASVGGALAGVSITINGQTIITDVNGNAVINLQDGTYDYTAVKAGYHTLPGTVTVAGAAVNKNLVMFPVTVTFNVTHNGQGVSGATVTLQGYTPLITPTNGTVVFNVVPNGNYTWSVTHPDYGDVNGDVTVANEQNQTLDILLDGISDLSAFNFNLYPNPSNGTFNLTTSAMIGYESNITVFDLAGKLVYTSKLQGNDVNVIDLSNQEKGMYLLQIVVEDKVYNKTLVIQ